MQDTPPFPTLKEVERAHVARVMAHYGSRKTEAARALGVCLKTLYNKLNLYGVTPPYPSIGPGAPSAPLAGPPARPRE